MELARPAGDDAFVAVAAIDRQAAQWSVDRCSQCAKPKKITKPNSLSFVTLYLHSNTNYQQHGPKVSVNENSVNLHC